MWFDIWGALQVGVAGRAHEYTHILDSSGMRERVNPQKVYRMRRVCWSLRAKTVPFVWVDAAVGLRSHPGPGRHHGADLPLPGEGNKRKLREDFWSSVSRKGGGVVGLASVRGQPCATKRS